MKDEPRRAEPSAAYQTGDASEMSFDWLFFLDLPSPYPATSPSPSPDAESLACGLPACLPALSKILSMPEAWVSDTSLTRSDARAGHMQGQGHSTLCPLIGTQLLPPSSGLSLVSSGPSLSLKASRLGELSRQSCIQRIRYQEGPRSAGAACCPRLHLRSCREASGCAAVPLERVCHT